MIDRLSPHIGEALLLMQENSSGVIDSVVSIFRKGSFNLDQNFTKTNRQIFNEDVAKVLAIVEVLLSYNYLDEKELTISKENYFSDLRKITNLKIYTKGQQLEFDF